MTERAIIVETCSACNGTGKDDDSWDGSCIYCTGGEIVRTETFCSNCGQVGCQCDEVDDLDCFGPS